MEKKKNDELKFGRYLAVQCILLVVFFLLMIGQAHSQDPPEGSGEQTLEMASGVSATGEEIVLPEVTPEEFEKFVDLAISAYQNGEWSILIGCILMLAVWVANKFGLKDKIGKSLVPWVACGAGILISMAINLVQGSSIKGALIQGLISGFSAIGLWELIFKRLLAKKSS